MARRHAEVEQLAAAAKALPLINAVAPDVNVPGRGRFGEEPG